MLDRATTAGVDKILLTGMSLADVDFNLAIARSRPAQCRITVGVHPYHAAEPEEDAMYFDQLFTLIHVLLKDDQPLLVAYGELGLDYDHTEKASADIQRKVFKQQLDLYIQHNLDLPIFLHCRSAFNDFVQILRPYMSSLPQRGVVHSFVGSKDQMHTLVDMGLDVSVNGFSFRDRESIEMVGAIPLNRLQLETDAPWGLIPNTSEVAKRYLGNVRPAPPSKKRDKFELGCMVKDRNESCTIDRVAHVVAGLKGLTVEEVATAAYQNSAKMFKFG